MNKIISQRMRLEKKYSNICLHHHFPLIETENKIISVSPGNFYFHTSINANGDDFRKYRILNSKAHFGERKKVEEEVYNIFPWKLFMDCYFFEMKNIIINYPIEKINYILISNNLKPIRIQLFNRLKRLLRKWTFLSSSCHYKITGAKKRLHRKYMKNMER